MGKGGNVPVWAWELAMVGATVIWGGSFVVLKGALDAMSAGWLMTLRFALSTLALSALFWPRLRDNLDGSHLVAGLAVGVLEGLAFVVQNVGLSLTTPGRNAFLTATYVVMTPFLVALLARRAPRASSVGAAILCLAGIGLLSLGDDLSPSLGAGDWLTLLSALLFAAQMTLMGRLAPAHDVVTLTACMFGAGTLTCLAYSLVAEPLPDLVGLPADFWWQLAYVVLLATLVALLVQNKVQEHVSPSKAALLSSLESVFGVVFSVALYGEEVTPQILAGFCLIFAAIVLSEMAPGGKRQEA